MKHNAVLVVSSLLSILLLTLHITDDIVRGISKAEPSNSALLRPHGRSWHGRSCSANGDRDTSSCSSSGCSRQALPVIHMRGTHCGEIAKSTGGFFFVWTLWHSAGWGSHPHPLGARTLESAHRGQPK